MLENCWKGHSNPKSNAHIQQFSWELLLHPPPQNHSFQYPLLSQLGHAAGYIDPCLLQLLKQFHQNDGRGLYHNVHEIIQIATTISFAEASCKNDAFGLPEDHKVTKGEISSNVKIEGPDGLAANHFAMKLGKQFCNLSLLCLDWSFTLLE